MCMKAPTTKYSDVKSIVEGELGRPINEVFIEFDENPLASASLA
jgi:predicted unusual protein kinase regulating ubiquinone biosynthesis (AarF/ABC1/UbiB family)